ncbi:MAG: hypothetical protein CMG54_04520 [Candidatus Marinimicrobia bacterium]|nr:hypothetical protein [Candidatus Neomarinimicrobiota bacterium]
MKIAGILTIGNEILQGYTLDTNAQSISEELNKRNIKTTIHLSIPDDIFKIKEKVDKFIIKNYDYIFITGGLGPTHDDITKKALIELFETEIKFLSDRHTIISKKFNKVNLPKCQSEILAISNPLENSIGTALGMYFKFKKSEIIILPGVPIEMKSMLCSYLDDIKKIRKVTNNVITINTCGIYETKLYEKVKFFISKNDKHIFFSFLPSYEGVKIRLTALSDQANLNKTKNELVKILDDYAYGIDKVTLEEKVSNILINKNLNLSICESCTGGFISKSLTDISGSSKFFIGSVVAYNNLIKQKIVKIPKVTLDKYGAVSKQVSEKMALNISKIFKTNISIACTGISGPEGGTKEKPLGTVFISIYYLDKIKTKKFIFNVDRKSHRLMTKQASLYMLWRILKEI